VHVRAAWDSEERGRMDVTCERRVLVDDPLARTSMDWLDGWIDGSGARARQKKAERIAECAF